MRPLADQAAYAIELYTEISGVDYLYGELNLVNDPSPALYGQAPSSLIYLGSLVFRAGVATFDKNLAKTPTVMASNSFLARLS